MSNENVATPNDDAEAEAARAFDQSEADIWVRHLADIGIRARTERYGRWGFKFFFGKRWSGVALIVPLEDLERARDSLKQHRYIL